MSTTAVLEANAGDLLREGWSALVDTLGIQKATRFVVLLERGKGDSVQEIADYWDGSDIDDIHRKVLDWISRKGP